MESLPVVPRSSLDRRSGHDRRNLSCADAFALEVCRKAGVKFVGLQDGFGSIPTHLLFQRDDGTTTLAVPAEGVTPEVIAERLRGHHGTERKHFERWYPATNHSKIEISIFANRVG